MNRPNRTNEGDLLEKLLLGRLSSAEAERIEADYSSDDGLAALAESLAETDAMLRILRQNRVAQADPDSEVIIQRLLERLQVVLPTAGRSETLEFVQGSSNAAPFNLMGRGGRETVGQSGSDTEPDNRFELADALAARALPERFEYYRPIRILGEGGMGTVYLAEDTRLGRQVALKTMKAVLAADPQAHQRFLREARTAAKLGHDHIVPIYYVGESDGTPFLAMPLLKGESLDALLRRTSGPLPIDLAVRIAIETLSGLAAAHESGLIHRDVKPANIWLEAPGGRVKVLDFGLAKAADGPLGGDADAPLTSQGVIVGTPSYMAPEQASGRPVGPRADLFSLGCVLYEMLTGKRSFAGRDTLAILMSLANHTPPAPHTLNRDCPEVLSAAVMKLLEKDPEHRPASAQAAIDLLTGTEHTRPSHSFALSSELGVPVAAAKPITRAKVEPRAPRRQMRVGVLVGLLMLGIAGVMFGGPIYRVATNQGELIIQIDDPNVEVKIVRDGVVVHDPTTRREFTLRAGNGEIEVLEKDGVWLTTREFTLTRGGKTTVKVSAADLADVRSPKRSAPAQAKSTSPVVDSAEADRAAAEWILSQGGDAIVGPDGRKVRRGEPLPKEPFKLTGFYLIGAVTDADLARFRDCANLESISFGDAGYLTDAGVATFAHNERLNSLLFNNMPRLTDACLAPFRNSRKLEYVSFASCPNLTDAGLAHLRNVPGIRSIHFRLLGQITSGGLEHLIRAKHLETLIINACPKIGNEALVSLKNCTNVKQLSLYNQPGLTDETLAAFTDFKALETLELGGLPKVTSAGLAAFKNAPDLRNLNLGSLPNVDDAGLGHFKDRKQLEVLELSNLPRITDAGLASFSSGNHLIRFALENCENVGDGGLAAIDVSRITQLYLSDQARITDAGLAAVEDCSHLGIVRVRGFPKVTDAGLAHFSECTRLGDLMLGDLPNITAAGLAHFGKCRDLSMLTVDSIPLNDSVLPVIEALPKLRALTLSNTCISYDGYRALKQNLGNCQISWSDPNRSVAEGTLALGGRVEVSDFGQSEMRTISASDTLPGTFFQVRSVSVSGITTPLDAALNPLGPLTLVPWNRFERLDLSNIPGLNYFGLDNFRTIRVLSLANCGLNDDSVARLPKMPSLERLVLDGNEIRGACFTALNDQPVLSDLSLACPSITDRTMIQLAGLKRLKRLSLVNTRVSDVGLKPLAGLTNLESVDLTGTRVTPAGVAELQKPLPRCRIIGLPK